MIKVKEETVHSSQFSQDAIHAKVEHKDLFFKQSSDTFDTEVRNKLAKADMILQPYESVVIQRTGDSMQVWVKAKNNKSIPLQKRLDKKVADELESDVIALYATYYHDHDMVEKRQEKPLAQASQKNVNPNNVDIKPKRKVDADPHINTDEPKKLKQAQNFQENLLKNVINDFVDVFDNLYLTWLSKTTTWGGALELGALSKIYNVLINLYKQEEDEIALSIRINNNNDNKSTAFNMIYSGTHYNSFINNKKGNEPGDGSCMFHAFANLLNHHNNTTRYNAQDLRNEVVNHFRQYQPADKAMLLTQIHEEDFLDASIKQRLDEPMRKVRALEIPYDGTASFTDIVEAAKRNFLNIED